MFEGEPSIHTSKGGSGTFLEPHGKGARKFYLPGRVPGILFATCMQKQSLRYEF